MDSGNGNTGASPADVAIVGMACVFPGAPDLETYWRNIVSKVDAVSDPPADWGADLFYDPNSAENDRVYCKRGGYLHELAEFDPLEYGVMPSSIDGGEPDHFLALRVAHEALADAGYRRNGPRVLPGDRTEVIVGRGAYINRGFTNLVQHGLVLDQTLSLLKQLHPQHTTEELAEIRQKLKAALPPFNAEMAPGLVPNILSGRIANRLDLMGPNFTIDAACASSLIAVERAMQDLLDGRCDVALAGGIHCSSPPPIFMVFCQLNALSRSGRISPFGEDADGTLLGEGLGMIVLKRRGDAVRDGDRIYAIIKAVGSASDGRALGLLAPRVDGEELAMRRAYEACGVETSSIGMVEAHGTGTAVGDQTEAEALARVFGARNGLPPRCAIGSVKSMISHLIPAAGIAGIIKTALALHYKILPPTLHCERPNPKLGFDRTPLYINTETRPWIHGLITPRRAGVNAFGFGGINAHAILEEAPTEIATREADGGPVWESEAFLLRADSRDDLIDRCVRLAASLNPAASPAPNLRDIAFTVNCSNGADVDQELCLAIVASSPEDLKLKLEHCSARLRDSACRNIRDMGGMYFFERMLAREGKIAFLFPGEGSQYVNMFAGLCLHLPPVRAWFDLIDRAFADHPRGWLPSQVIFPPPIPNDPDTLRAQEMKLQETDFAAEAVFAANQGILDLLHELQIYPDAVVGHSGGDISALLAAGAIRVSNDAELIRHIGEINQLYVLLAAEGLVPDGCAIAVSGVERDEVIRAIRESGSSFAIGMDNCPHQMVVCGARAQADRLLEALRSIGALCLPLPFQRPYHTAQFEPYCTHLRPFYDGLHVVRPRIPAYSAATASQFPDEPDEIRELATRQIALPVRFRETIDAMHRDGVRIFIESGPKGNLTSFVSDTLRDRPHLAIASDLPQVPNILQLNRMLAQLAAHGVPMRLDPLYVHRGAVHVSLDELTHPAADTKRGIRLATGLTQLRLPDLAFPGTESSREQPVAAALSAAAPRRSISHLDASENVGHTPPESTPVQASEPMLAYLATMDKFLSVQQEAMHAYLASGNRRNGVGVSATPQPVTRPGTVAVAEKAATVVQDPPSVTAEPDAAVNGHDNVLQTLVEIISERTGYPTEMLKPGLNLEADLGIDSIKRVEILGTVHRQTGLLPPEKMEHVAALRTIAEIQAFLTANEKPVATVAPAPPFSLVGNVDLHRPGEKLIFSRSFDLKHDLFLKDHALGGHTSGLDPGLTGLPLIPLTMTVEMMAQAASTLLPGRTLVAMENVRASRWLAVEDSGLVLRVEADRDFSDPREAVRVKTFVEGISAPAAEATAILADRYPDPPQVTPIVLQSPRPSQWTPERLYRDHMFHGASFRGIQTIDQWGRNGLTATLASPVGSGLFRDVENPLLLTDPVLVDSAGQMVGYWAAEHLSDRFNVFPYRIGVIKLYRPALPKQRRVSCQACIRVVDESRIDADLDVTDESGRLVMKIEGWEDRRVDMPENFYRLCISPRDVFLSTSRMLGPRTSLCSIALTSLPPFSANGGIWLRTLACAVLSERERRTWRELAGPESRRIEWLLGRCCVKDAVRLLARNADQPALWPADIEIAADDKGKPIVLSPVIEASVSISHADGVAMAAATLNRGVDIGIDVQRLSPGRDGFEDAAFCEEELALVGDRTVDERRETFLRMWCAKEAASKALGCGLIGGPGSLRVRSLRQHDGKVRLETAGAAVDPSGNSKSLDAHTERHGDLIFASCMHRAMGEIHEFSNY